MGFEALYWVPFVAHLRHTLKIQPENVIVLSRGGTGAWYAPAQRVELYDYVPPKDLRLLALEGQQRAGSVKQLRMSNFERRLVELVATRIGIQRYGLLHPSRMYQTLDAFWTTQTMGLATAMTHLRIEPMPTCQVPLGMALPEKFVAVRWYARPTWPLRPELLEWSQAMVRSLAATVPVVILQSSQYFDDHVDFPAPIGPNITVIAAEPWRDNLAIQTAILQKAVAFVGTWGGMAQLAVRLRIPTVAFYERWHGCSYQHLVFTQWVALQQGTTCVVGRPADIEGVRSVLPQPIMVPDPPRGSSS